MKPRLNPWLRFSRVRFVKPITLVLFTSSCVADFGTQHAGERIEGTHATIGVAQLKEVVDRAARHWQFPGAFSRIDTPLPAVLAPPATGASSAPLHPFVGTDSPHHLAHDDAMLKRLGVSVVDREGRVAYRQEPSDLYRAMLARRAAFIVVRHLPSPNLQERWNGGLTDTPLDTTTVELHGGAMSGKVFEIWARLLIHTGRVAEANAVADLTQHVIREVDQLRRRRPKVAESLLPRLFHSGMTRADQTAAALHSGFDAIITGATRSTMIRHDAGLLLEPFRKRTQPLLGLWELPAGSADGQTFAEIIATWPRWYELIDLYHGDTLTGDGSDIGSHTVTPPNMPWVSRLTHADAVASDAERAVRAAKAGDIFVLAVHGETAMRFGLLLRHYPERETVSGRVVHVQPLSSSGILVFDATDGQTVRSSTHSWMPTN